MILHADYIVIGIIRYNNLMVYMEQLHILGILGCMLQCFREISNLVIGLKRDIYLSASLKIIYIYIFILTLLKD